MGISIFKAVPNQQELTDLETRVSHILGWQAGTVEVRETIKEFRLGKRPYDRYSKKQIDELTAVISPPQGVTVTRPAKGTTRFSPIGGK